MEDIDEIDNGWDRSLLYASTYPEGVLKWGYHWVNYRLLSPLTSNHFENEESYIKEIEMRALAGLSVLLVCWVGLVHILPITVLSLSAAAIASRAVALALQKNGVTHIRTKCEDQLLGKSARAMLWNIRGDHYKESGMTSWPFRIEQIAEKIRAEDAEIVVLLDVSDAALVEALVERLGNQYGHFYAHLNATLFGNTKGSLILTKCALSSFENIPFMVDGKKSSGFQTFEIQGKNQKPCLRIVTSMLGDVETKRMEEVSHIVHHLAEKHLQLPTLFLGSTCYEDEELGSLIQPIQWGENRTHQFAEEWDPKAKEDPRVDVVGLFRRASHGKELPVIERNVRLSEKELVKAYNDGEKRPASDRHAIIAGIEW